MSPPPPPGGGQRTWIEQLRLEGFGRFSEVELELKPGLNLVHGRNEAGKSTLLAFLQAALFGFERGQAARWEPRSGGAFGGVLALATPAGPLQVRLAPQRRRAEGERTLTGGGGQPLGEADLARALGGVSRQLFRQVFAITLDELQDFRSLADEAQVSEALFAAAALGAQRLPEVLARLRDEAAEVYAPRGQRPLLNQALRQLEEVRGRLLALATPPQEYFRARARLEALGQQEAGLRQALPRLRAQAQRLEQLERARGPLLQLRALPASGPPDDGSPEAVARLDALEDRRLQVLRALAPVEGPLERLQAERARLEAALAARGPVAEARAALAGWRRVEPAAATLEPEGVALAERKLQLQTEVTRLVGRPLGPGWLEGLDAGAARLAELKAFRDREAQLAGQRARDEELARAAAADEERLRLAQAGVASRLAAGGPGSEAVEAASAALEQLLTAAAALEHRQARRRDLEERAAQDQPEDAPPGPWLGAGALAAALGCLALAVAAAAALGGATLAAPVGLVAAALGAVLAGAWARARGTAGERRRAWEGREQVRAARQRAWAQERLALAAELASLQLQLEQLGQRAGVRAPAEAPHRRQALARQRQQAEELRQLEREAVRLEQELGAARQRRAEAARRLAAAGAERDDIQRQLDAQLTTSGFSAGLGAQQALDLLSEAARLQQARASLARDAARHRAAEAEVEQARVRLAAQAGRLGLAGAEGPRLAVAVEAALEQDQQERAALQAASARCEELQAARAQALAERDDVAARLAELLQAFGASEPEALRQRARDALQARSLEARRQALALEVQAAALAPPAEVAAELDAAGDLEAARARVGAQLEAAEAQAREVGAERGGLAERLQAQEAEAAAAGLRAEEARLAAQVSSLARRHARLAVAAAALQGARRAFEAAHQPRIVGRVSALFGQLTQGRYPRVALEPEARTVCALDDTGTAWRVTELSRGTRELLLLAFRLAVAEDLGEARVRLPVVLDDVLVDLDPGRAARAAEVLAELATRHQVVVLTCHPQVRRLFESSAAAVLPLQEGKQLSLLDGRGV